MIITHLGTDYKVLLSPEDEHLPNELPGRLKLYRHAGKLIGPRIVLGPNRRTVRLNQLIALKSRLKTKAWIHILADLHDGNLGPLSKELLKQGPIKCRNNDPLDCRRENLRIIPTDSDLAPPTQSPISVPPQGTTISTDIPDFLK